MKTQTILALALWLALGACQGHREEAQTILSGILPDAANETLTLVPVDAYFPSLSVADTFPTVQTDSLGRYTFRLAGTRAAFYQIISNNYPQLDADIYLEPGDSLHIEQSSWREEPKFAIRGKGSEKLQHLENDHAVFSKDRAFYSKINSDYFATELDFKRFIDSIHFKRIEALAASKGTPEVVRSHHVNTLQAERAMFLLGHLERRNYYVKETFDYFFPDDRYFDFLDSIDFGGDFPHTTAARLLASIYLNYQVRHAFKSKTEDEWQADNWSWRFGFIAQQAKSTWRDILALGTMSDYYQGLTRDDFFDDLDRFYKNMNQHFSRDTNQRLFDVNIASYQNLAPGKPAPDFALPDAKGVLRRLSDYKGTIVYLDFWGTWCQPCIHEIPDALKLQETYKDAPVTFLYVALESDSSSIAHWKEFTSPENKIFGDSLSKKPFSGVHLVAEKQIRNEAIRPYELRIMPTHVLIDPKGNIVKTRSKRPNKIQADIDELLRGM